VVLFLVMLMKILRGDVKPKGCERCPIPTRQGKKIELGFVNKVDL